MKVEIKIHTTERLKNRLKILAKERNISLSSMAEYLLEKGLYKYLEEESIYGETKYKQITSK